MKKILSLLLLFGGLFLVETKLTAKPNTCVACHGEAGLSTNSQWPNLAGQSSNYLIKQLQDFKTGKRNNPIMVAMSVPLTETDITDLANFYASQPLPPRDSSTKFLKRGELLYRSGDSTKQINACIVCHGPRGEGNAQAGFPALKGQHALYTLEQLQAFKEARRSNDLKATMRALSRRMSQEDMEAVAYYVQDLP